ncbi:GNAT family N-acetyltransferase [Nocardioides sp.]|uniref:GNAT family N-acetyltransferase n=1 Tax=Nocardioides sp. TaxID=35761 RepID=UPI003D14E436
MTTIEILRVDPFDDVAFDAWHATQFAADRFGREEHATPWMLEESRVDKQSTLKGRDTLTYSLLVDGAVATAAEVWLPLLDNLDLAEVVIHTHPEHRRRGYAARMLAHLEDEMRVIGRSKLITEAAYPYDAPPDGSGHPGPDFLTSQGFTFGLADVKRVVSLPIADEILAGLLDEAAPHHTAYSLVSCVGRLPDEHVQAYAELDAAIVTDAPMGELDLETPAADVEDIRDNEALMARQHRRRYTTLAIAPDGTAVAYSDLVMPEEDPGKVYQWGTLVRSDHRGHRLGLAVKAANLRFLQSQRSDARLLSTYNAEVNAHMIAVNDRMGFQPVERLGEFQKRLTDVGLTR